MTDLERSKRPSKALRLTIGEVGRLIRPAAVLALFSMLLAQAISPAIKTAGLSLGRLIDHIDLVANISSHMFALTSTALCIGLLFIVGRDTRVSLVARVLLVAQTTIVLVLAVPASRFRLSPFACFFLGAVTCSTALVAAVEGLREPRSRAQGLILAVLGLAGAARIASAGLVAIPSASQVAKLVPISNAAATGAVTLHALALLFALAWLASRRRSTVSIGTLAALALAMFITWAGSSARPTASVWVVFAARIQDHLIPLPLSVFPRVIDGFVAVLGPAVAAVALVTRRQMGTLVGAVALALTAGTMVDVPGHALIMVLASLATVLAAHDDQGMWEALMGKRLAQQNESPPPMTPTEAPSDSQPLDEPKKD